MRLDQNPVFRKPIVPWYDSETACLIVIIGMFLVFVFASAGVAVAREQVHYRAHLWVPALLMLLSSAVIISTTLRLINRYAQRYAK